MSLSGQKITETTIDASLQDGSNIYASDSGSTDAYAINLTPSLTAYTTGSYFNFRANTQNTGSATLNIDSLGAKTIKKQYNQDLADGDIKAGQICSVIYDGTNFQLQSQIGNSASSIPTVYRRTTNFTGSGNITGMSFSASANKKYLITLALQTYLTGSGEYRLRFVCPSDSKVSGGTFTPPYGWVSALTETISDSDAFPFTYINGDAIDIASLCSSAYNTKFIYGSILLEITTSGTVYLNFNTSLTMYAGSIMVVQEVTI